MNELNEDKILNNISIMIEAANEIREDNEILGDIFLANLKNSLGFSGFSSIVIFWHIT